jgi:hypothetical protein
VGTTKSISIIIITSTATRISVAATATTLGAETAHPINQLAAEEIAAETPAGSTIRNIAAVHRIGTGRRRTGSAARHVETPYPIARLVPANR